MKRWKKMNEIIIRPDEITSLAVEGGKLLFQREASENLAKLLRIQKLINDAVESAKEAIIEAGLAIDTGFSGVHGDEVSATYRFFGDKYKNIDTEIAKPFLKEVKYYKVDSDKVEEYLEEVGELPAGIEPKGRTKSLVFRLKGVDEN